MWVEKIKQKIKTSTKIGYKTQLKHLGITIVIQLNG